MAVGSVAVEFEQRRSAPHLAVAQQRQPAVVENDPVAVESDGDHRMGFPGCIVAHDHEPDVLLRHAGGAERDVFGDGIVFAIAALRCERLERRAPAVGDAPLGKVGGRHNRQVYFAIDHANAGPAISLAVFIDDR